MKYEDVIDVNRGKYSVLGTYLGYIYKYELEIGYKFKRNDHRHTITAISRLSPKEYFLQHKIQIASIVRCKEEDSLKLISHKIKAITNDKH